MAPWIDVLLSPGQTDSKRSMASVRRFVNYSGYRRPSRPASQNLFAGCLQEGRKAIEGKSKL